MAGYCECGDSLFFSLLRLFASNAPGRLSCRYQGCGVGMNSDYLVFLPGFEICHPVPHSIVLHLSFVPDFREQVLKNNTLGS